MFLIKLLFSVYYLIWEVPVVKKHAYFFIYYTFFISGIPVCHSGPCQYDVWWTPRNKSDLIYCNLSSIVSPFNFIVCRENNAELFFPASWYPFAKLFASIASRHCCLAAAFSHDLNTTTSHGITTSSQVLCGGSSNIKMLREFLTFGWNAPCKELKGPVGGITGWILGTEGGGYCGKNYQDTDTGTVN